MTLREFIKGYLRALLAICVLSVIRAVVVIGLGWQWDADFESGCLSTLCLFWDRLRNVFDLTEG